MTFERRGTKKEYKTDTVKKRSLYVYLPSMEMTDRWKRLAQKSGLSISKFIIEHVENSIKQEEDKKTYTPRAELLKTIGELKEENKKLRRRNKMLDTVIERLEEELRIYRAEPFIEEQFEGIRKYEEDLIKLFRERGEIKKEDLLEALGIKPNERDAVKGINRQIENLERYGLIKSTRGKWKWNQ